MARFVLRSKQNCEILDGTNLATVEGIVMYRVSIEIAVDAELKIITDGIQPKIISSASLSRSLDIAVRKHLFIEATGQNGIVAGNYEFLGAI